jgi:hypothetical protein
MPDYTIDTTVSGGNTFSSDVAADVTARLTGLDDMRLTLEPMTTSSTATTTSRVDSASSLDTTSSVDLKPVAVDTCVRLELGPPPATEVCTPYEQTWGWSVLGLELFAVTVRGSATTHIRPEHHNPVVIDL